MSVSEIYHEWRARRAHRRMWDEVEDWDGLCSLQALWCEGDLVWCPTYDGPRDPETEGIAEALALVNRSGFLTMTSQPGSGPEDVEDTHPRYPAVWSQRAAVEGFARDDVLERLRAAVAGTRLELQANRRASGWGVRAATGVEVTLVNDRPHIHFGSRLSKWHLETYVFDNVPDGVLREVGDAWQVLIYDPHWGDHRLLWDRLLTV